MINGRSIRTARANKLCSRLIATPITATLDASRERRLRLIKDAERSERSERSAIFLDENRP